MIFEQNISPALSSTNFMPTRHSPMGLIGKLMPDLRFIEWLFCSHTSSKTLSPYLLALICSLILDGRQHCTKLTGHDPDIICLPLTKTQFEKALKTSIDLQIALADFIA